MSVLDELFEKTESNIKSFEDYEPKTPSERRHHTNLIREFSNSFQGLLNKAQKNLGKTENKLKFADLQSDINRHTAEHVTKIQQKMVVVNELMKDVAETVGKQGEVLDRIDIHVDDGKKYTTKAVEQLYKTDERQRTKKKCCWFMIFVAIAFLIAIIIVAVVVSKDKN